MFELSKQSKFKELFVVPGGKHDDFWKVAGEKYFQKIESFLRKCIKNYDIPIEFKESNPLTDFGVDGFMDGELDD